MGFRETNKHNWGAHIVDSLSIYQLEILFHHKSISEQADFPCAALLQAIVVGKSIPQGVKLIPLTSI